MGNYKINNSLGNYTHEEICKATGLSDENIQALIDIEDKEILNAIVSAAIKGIEDAAKLP